MDDALIAAYWLLFTLCLVNCLLLFAQIRQRMAC